MHKCKALNVRCIDFRFREFTDEYLEKKLGIHDFDLITKPGGIKEIAEKGKETDLFEDIALAISLHDPDKIILINHTDCGAYDRFESQEAETEKHKQDLLTAKGILSDEFEGKEIICVFITANSKAEDLKALIF